MSTPVVHPDLDELSKALLDMAEVLLREQGSFLPIGAIISSEGDIRHVGANIEGEEYPGAQPLIDLLTETFRRWAEEGKICAAGICYDVLTVPPGKEEKQDAMLSALEHCLGEAVNVFKPYSRTEGGDFAFEEVFATERTPQFFQRLPRG